MIAQLFRVINTKWIKLSETRVKHSGTIMQLVHSLQIQITFKGKREGKDNICN